MAKWVNVGVGGEPEMVNVETIALFKPEGSFTHVVFGAGGSLVVKRSFKDFCLLIEQTGKDTVRDYAN